jgi:spore germination protein YaaH
MKHRQHHYHTTRGATAFLLLLLLVVSACGADPGIVSTQSTPGQSVTVMQPTTVASTNTPAITQQHFPKGLLNPSYPVMDWVFNQTCSQAVTSYQRYPMNAALAYDSAAWLIPSDGHLVPGYQDCDNNALIQQARAKGLPTLLTVGIDQSWSLQSVAQYIDQASSQPAESCNASSTTDICAIVNWAASGDYSGVIIDIELVKDDYPGIQAKFALFMQKLQQALHEKGMLCGTTLIPKISDNPADDPFHNIDGFQNWHLLGSIDFLVDMELDFDTELNVPGPITSISWVGKQLNYLWQTMPQALSKTIFEFPLYSREWQQDNSGAWHRLNDETCAWANNQKASQTLLSNVTNDPNTPEIAWNDANGNRHEVWYNTPRSLLAVMTYLQQQAQILLQDTSYRLPTSFWYRGAECPGFFGPGNVLAHFYNQ